VKKEKNAWGERKDAENGVWRPKKERFLFGPPHTVFCVFSLAPGVFFFLHFSISYTIQHGPEFLLGGDKG
jgi:hypothetical protein